MASPAMMCVEHTHDLHPTYWSAASSDAVGNPQRKAACPSQHGLLRWSCTAGHQTSMKGRLASLQEDPEQQSRLARVPRESRLHRWVAAILPQDHRPAPPANTLQVTGSFLRLLCTRCTLTKGSGVCMCSGPSSAGCGVCVSHLLSCDRRHALAGTSCDCWASCVCSPGRHRHSMHRQRPPHISAS